MFFSSPPSCQRDKPLIALCRSAGRIVAMVALGVVPVGGVVAQVERTSMSVLRHLDVDEGLPNARVFTVAHTPDGYVWLGTYGGLARFDGLAFTTFTDADLPFLGGNSVTALTVDDRGTLWIGTEEGRLVACDDDGFRPIRVPVRPGRCINTIRGDGRGRLWLGTQDGVLVMDVATSACTAANDGLEAADVKSLAIDVAGTPWAVSGGGLYRWQRDGWQPIVLGAADDLRTTALAPATQGGVWCAASTARPGPGDTSLRRIAADGRVEAIPPGPWPTTAARGRIEALLEDDAGTVWCATRGSGVYCHTPDGGWREPGKGASLARADGICLSADTNGSVWVGTRNSGAYQISPSRVDMRQLPEQIGDHVVTSVCAQADGRLWAGTDGGGVVAWSEHSSQSFGIDDGLPSLDIAAVASARGGRVHVGTAKGIVVLEGRRFIPVRIATALPPTSCNFLFADGDDRLWVGTAAGVTVVNTAGFGEAVPCDDGSSLDAVAFTANRDGRIIALTRSGAIFALDGGRFRRIGDAADPQSRCRAIASDGDGGLWLGTYGGGIKRIAGGASRRWTMQENGLPSSHVLAILSQGDVMWVCSENGVFGCPVVEFAKAPTGDVALPTWRVGKAAGLPEKVCTAGGQPAASLGSDGRLWVPNGRFVAGFLPKEIMAPMAVYPPVVERVVADGRERIPYGAMVEVLPVGTERIELSFTSPNTVAPERLRFRHQLVGFDHDWVSVADRRTASYTGLPPGDYSFRVEVSDPPGSWRRLRKTVRIRIPARFWQRRDVQAASACGLAGALAAAGWAWEWRRSRARMTRISLDRARDQERQRIARDIHDDLGSGLTEIVMLSEVAEREPHASTVSATVRAIADRARELTRAMDEVVWAVNPHNDSTESFITYFHRWAQAYLGNAGLRIRWDLPIDSTDGALTAEMRHQLFLACKETVTNIVKHAFASEVRIACRPLPAALEISIEDDGRGFTPVRPSLGGDGLANMRARLAALGGDCDIRSGAERGTVVTFRVPSDTRTHRIAKETI